MSAAIGNDPLKPVILAVDDDPNNLAVVRDCLQECNYTVLVAEDGESAVTRADYALPDLILLDVMMPGIDGFETCRTLKARESTRHIPVIFMTALAETGHKVKGLEAGGVDYITKPFQREELLARIAVHLQLRDLTSRLQEAKETLEKKVAERTLDLAIANRELEDEIAVRQAAQEQLQAKAVILEEKLAELQQTQNALGKSERKFRAIFDQTFELMGLLTPDGLLLDANQAALNYCGAKESAVIGKPFWETPWWSYSEAQRGNVREAVAMAAAGGIVRFEAKYRDADNKIHYIDFSIKPLMDDDGNVLMLISEGRDITTSKKLEQELRQAQKMEAIGTLAAGIAHDFNNILTSIVGNTEMALSNIPAGEPVRRNIERVLESGSRATDLVKQILTFSRQSEQELKPVLLAAIINEVVNLLRSTLPSTIDIRTAIDIPPEDALVMADPIQLHQVLMNLCTNAAHAMRSDGGVLAITLNEVMADDSLISRHPSLKPGPHVILTVSDTGHGMDSSTVGRIFDPYFTTKKPGEGTGLGLSVTLGIVQSQGGTISVYSEPGQGTSFQIYLPKTDAKIAHSANKAEDPLPTGKERILFVDDEQLLVEMAQEMLNALGYHVVAVTSSLETLERFQAQPFAYDLLITDMTMPGLTGRELSRSIRAIRPDMPIIMCSGFTEFINAAEAKEAGISEFLMKPYSTASLAKAVRKALDEVFGQPE
ncbi:blue-light-activated protein [Geobacter sp. OR-1]|uniref:response regulator n=1 Tax=Geobacter sp. OR-1 TaxID=1266765 RepID=UPI000542BE13|nr:response regulator [Geobacter sp. OR-1]GAM08669.1 blue-light-activated protein [Geobacter sp. OR-1]